LNADQNLTVLRRRSNLSVGCRYLSAAILIFLVLEEPVVAQKQSNSINEAICRADGFPSPKISWMKLPQIGQRIFKMKSESTRKREWLRKWEYISISEKDSTSLQPDEIYICKAENKFLSKSTVFRLKRTEQAKSTDLVIRVF